MLNWMMLLFSLLQLFIPTILTNWILKIYIKASKLGNTSLAIYRALTKLPVPLNLSKCQCVPPNPSVRNSRANNAIIFGMRLVIPF